MSTTVFVPTGPAAEHRQGLADILEGLCTYEPDTRRVIVIYDGPPEELGDVSTGCGLRVDVVPHPRRRRGNPLFGGDCVVTLEGLRVATLELPELVVRLDTDALVIGGCFAELQAFLAAHPSVGIVGSVREGSQVASVARAANRLRHPVALYRDPPPGHRRLLQLLIGPNAHVRYWVRRARNAGWALGSHCQGGAAALSPHFLAALRDVGLLDRPLDWLDVPITGDVMLGALATALGFELADLSRPGEPFAVDYKRLPEPPAELVSHGRSLIHSLKSDPAGHTEKQLREFFAERRSREQ